ncbi:MAG: hypothetical protein Q9219_000881 [cf. Caloplaca sp. 3 TL-2023]
MAEPQLDRAGSPDIMNDPAFDHHAIGERTKSVSELDTCRICRAEGSDEEPLFYPCKCSGSIKFVHQNCLMEWLSHSQKKYCELCKTPFRFTKLYHSQMPATVPTLVFLRQVLIHTWNSFLTWSRMHVVILVWLCWLPWSMRTVWRGLFWIGDGGWLNWTQMEQEALKAAKERLDKLAAEGMSPAAQSHSLFVRDAASTIVSRLAEAIPQMVSRTLNLPAGKPVAFKLARGLLGRFVRPNQANDTDSLPYISPSNVSNVPSNPYRSSWLSEVGFLTTLTRYPILNNLIVDTLEGQLITILIVVAFILIFLIREWVVQQRPGQMVQAIPEVREEPPAIEDGDRPQNLIAGAINGDQQGLNEAPDAPEDADGQALYDSTVQSPQQLQSDGNNPVPNGQPTEANEIPVDDEDIQKVSTMQNTAEQSTSSHSRPNMPDRGTLARAAEIRRTIEEQSRTAGPEWPGLKIFMDLWTRANNKPQEVLRIIEEEGRTEELEWIIAAMGRLENIPVTTAVEGRPRNNSSQEHSVDPTHTRFSPDMLDNGIVDAKSIPSPRGSENGLRTELPAGYGMDSPSRTRDQDLFAAFTGTDDEADIINTNAMPSSAAEAIEQSSADGPSSIARYSEQASSSSSHLPDGSAQATDSPFHEDYTGPFPPYPDQHPGPEDLHRGRTTTNAAARSQPSQAVNNQATINRVEPNQTLIERTMIWLWGDASAGIAETSEQGAADDEHVVQDLADEAPFVPMEHGRLLVDGHEQDRGDNAEPEAAQAMIAAANARPDPDEVEANEDVEDLEGVMELVGMQGPIAGLIQNAMFCAILISLTIFLAIWLPYILGKVFLIILANPASLLLKLPLRWASNTADILSDTFIFGVTCTYYWVAKTVSFLCTPAKRFRLLGRLLYVDEILADFAKDVAENALGRLADAFTVTGSSMSESDIPTFSIVAHESLQMLQQYFFWVVNFLMKSAITVCSAESKHSMIIAQQYQLLSDRQTYQRSVATVVEHSRLFLDKTLTWLQNNPTSLASLRHLKFLHLDMSILQRTQPLDFRLAYWDTRDRVLAIILGYLFVAILGVFYVHLSRFFGSKKQEDDKAEGVVADVLYQASGVTKVVLIISIEMIVFPLYCGLLLDVALLPLFRGATILSRLQFLIDSPYTSLFVHWFVGTCYMFHFALFVSMCRKILRSGVLYFIRDPDDPTFHPVRDVLERSVFTQLSRIAFSALVYGGLVIVCLGGVVWSISSALGGVFPIHWSSNEPVLEFPVDLLFYNFLMPFAVKVLRPSDALTALYTWWFKICARGLRLSHFLFGDKREDEEGQHIRRTWKDVFQGKRGDATKPVIGEDRQLLAEDRKVDAFFLRNGRYVRAPASDQVRIPKGVHTFVEVDEAGNRVDGTPDSDQGLHGRRNEKFSTIYVPPYFRLRIGAFVFLLWIFAAVTGVCVTIVPLVFGRYAFSCVFPSHPRMNDVYAFSIGINILGGALFLLLNARYIVQRLRRTLSPSPDSTTLGIFHKALHHTSRFLRVLYTYSAFTLLLPSLLALIIELYFITPLHTYFSRSTADQHTIYFVQDWTLGVLYLQMVGRLILWNEQSRPAIALRNIIQNGWTDPNARLATRGFIFPATMLMLTLLLAPLGLGWLANNLFDLGSEQLPSTAYRYSYPTVLAFGIGAVVVRYLSQAFQGWKRRIRDEVYLIGERLHNFGERRTVNTHAGARIVA